MPTYSIVVPVHNEEEVLSHLFEALDSLCDQLDGTVEFIFVDDGSIDDSWRILGEQAARDTRCRIVRLSRNFGHQVAVTAGLDTAKGDAVVIMDADLQDPPAVVLDMARRWREGYDVVYGQRVDRDEDTRFKRLSAGLFYKLLKRMSSVDIPEQVGDFRLIDRAVVEAMKQMPERNRYVRGMFAWLGFRQIGVEYQRPARRAGSTSYTLRKMLRLANDGVVGYSKVPLRAPVFCGVVFLVGGTAGGVTSGLLTITTKRSYRSLSSWSVAAVFGGAQLLAIGILGEYVSRIFDESLGRPLYVVSDTRGGESMALISAVKSPNESCDDIDDFEDDEAIAVNGQLHSIFTRRNDNVRNDPARSDAGHRQRRLVRPTS